MLNRWIWIIDGESVDWMCQGRSDGEAGIKWIFTAHTINCNAMMALQAIDADSPCSHGQNDGSNGHIWLDNVSDKTDNNNDKIPGKIKGNCCLHLQTSRTRSYLQHYCGLIHVNNEWRDVSPLFYRGFCRYYYLIYREHHPIKYGHMTHHFDGENTEK